MKNLIFSIALLSSISTFATSIQPNQKSLDLMCDYHENKEDKLYLLELTTGYISNIPINDATTIYLEYNCKSKKYELEAYGSYYFDKEAESFSQILSPSNLNVYFNEDGNLEIEIQDIKLALDGELLTSGSYQNVKKVKFVISERDFNDGYFYKNKGILRDDFYSMTIDTGLEMSKKQAENLFDTIFSSKRNDVEPSEYNQFKNDFVEVMLEKGDTPFFQSMVLFEVFQYAKDLRKASEEEEDRYREPLVASKASVKNEKDLVKAIHDLLVIYKNQ